jgi:hypothetical protein
MFAWRVDAQTVHIGQGTRLPFSLTIGAIATGDTSALSNKGAA